jgi:acetamidase/formamidase
VRGAKPGDVLEIRIIDVKLRQDWGYTYVRPLAGALPNDFPAFEQMIVRLDQARNVGILPWGTELPLRPFFGVMGVAPPKEWGMISTIQPRAHGGNLDNKELIPGSTLYLPVHVEGGRFSCGDGHGVQGDGEVCINALEICLTGTFTLTLHKMKGSTPLLAYPRGETATHYISMGMNEDLDVAMRQALRQMITFICSRSNLSREEAYQFCSLAVDFRVTQTVNGEKGIHGMLKKGLLF